MVSAFCLDIAEAGNTAKSEHQLRWNPQNSQMGAILDTLDTVRKQLTDLTQSFPEQSEMDPEMSKMYQAAVRVILVS